MRIPFERPSPSYSGKELRGKEKKLMEATAKSSRSIWVLTAYLNKEFEGALDNEEFDQITKTLEEYIDQEGPENCCVDQRALDMYSILMLSCSKVILGRYLDNSNNIV